MARASLRGVAAALVVCGGLLSLTACATPASPDKMTVPAGLVPTASEGAKAYKAFRVAQVQGGSETNPLMASDVSDADFRLALEASLRNIEYLAPDLGGAYLITASIVELKQPFAGLDLTVTAKVRYTVVPAAGGAPILDETIVTPATAKMGEAFAAVERLRLANEASVRANIAAFVTKLTAQVN